LIKDEVHEIKKYHDKKGCDNEETKDVREHNPNLLDQLMLILPYMSREIIWVI
jgi:hypothetical protein